MRALLGQSWSVELAQTDSQTFAETHDLTPESYEGVTRLDRLTQIPATMLETLFAGDEGSPVLSLAEGQALLARIGATEAPDLGDAQTEQLVAAVDEQIGQALAQDVFTYFARALQADAGISLNQAAIDAVHTSFR